MLLTADFVGVNCMQKKVFAVYSHNVVYRGVVQAYHTV